MLYGFAITTNKGTEYGIVSAEDEDSALFDLKDFAGFYEVELIDAESVVLSQYSGIMLGASQ